MVTHPAREAVVADTTDDAGKARASKAKVVRHAGMVVAMVTGKAREIIKATAITRGKALKVMEAKATADKAATVVARAKPTAVVVRVATVIKATRDIRVAADNNVVKVVADATVNSKVVTAVVVKAATRTSSDDTRVGTIPLAPLQTSLLSLYQEWMFLVKTSCWHLQYQPSHSSLPSQVFWNCTPRGMASFANSNAT
jgi:hypothetical protein